MINALIIVIAFVFDGVLTNFLPYMPNDLSLFTPLLTLTTIFLIYPFYKKKEVSYYLLIFFLGIIYDLFYTNLLFFNAILFLGIGIFSKYIYKNFNLNYFKIIIYIIMIIVVYEATSALLILIFNLVPITLERILYKITHSLLLNIIYAEIIYFIINLLPKKYKDISINWE